jgi:hypothetical protein
MIMAINNDEEKTAKPDNSEKSESPESASVSKKITVKEFDEPEEIAVDVEPSEELLKEAPEEDETQLEEEALPASVAEDDQPELDDPVAEEEVATDPAPTVGDAIDLASSESEDVVDTAELTDNKVDGTEESTQDDIGDLVDDIVRSESTEQLTESDAKLTAAAAPIKKSGFKSKLKSGLKKWWQTTWLRNTAIVIASMLVLAIILIPTTRYGVLNSAGVRVKSNMTVIDAQTRLPLKNIQVQLQDKTADTDKQGNVSFEGLKLGSSQLVVTKRGYADNKRNITLGWGSNPIGDQEIIATGEQFTFILVDWLSGERVINAEATAGENSSNSDSDGKIILTIAQESIGEDAVVISAEGYRDEIIKPEDLSDADIEVVMVPNRRHAFVSNRDAKFDVYVIDLDGQNEELLLEATQKEREVPGIVPHSSNNVFALVSSRDGVENVDKYILDGLFIINADNGSVENIGRSERVQLLGWSGDWLVYTQVVEGTSRGNAERSKIFSFNNQTGEKIELAAANYFNDIELVDDVVTYAVSSFAIPQSRARLYSVTVEGNDKQELLNKQVYTIFRTSQTALLFNAVDQEWYASDNNEQVTLVDPVLSPSSQKYVTSPDGTRVAWSVIRDGRGVLFTSDRDGDNETEVAVISGLDSIEYWANNKTIVYRVIKSEETADYVLHIEKPENQRKIADVTASKRIFF